MNDLLHGIRCRLLLAREQKGYTQRNAAFHSGVPRVSIAQIERGDQKPSVVQLVKLAEAYGVDACWVLRGDAK